ncbi:hypothetical protein BDR04DRAFT_1129211 [Suillus decipiens]|nr:hypothetical protein BDR04DRAFT_1129211 [Suillus decipiens]
MGTAPIPITLSSLPTVPSAHSNLDTFKMGYHLHSGCATSPFACCVDFKFAELAHGVALNKNQTDELLQLIWRIVDGQMTFTFKSHGDVSKAWDRAAAQMTPFKKHTITIQHKQEDLEYNMYMWPLWDWALDLLQDPLLMPHFSWDAQRLYKHDGTCYEHFVHEPWTADRWWNVQSSLPKNGVPFAFILYADKTHLSSAGMVKAYPVFAQCGNLPVGIRNTDGLGGGRMVGWLPIVPDDSEEDSKLMYVNLKWVVWHKSFLKLLETIMIYAKMGYAYVCYDGIMSVPNSDPHNTISQDHLHVYHMGQWKHLFGELKRHIEALGCSTEKQMDDQFNAFPRWCNLNHFDWVTNITYSNGNKLRDISKQILYAAQNILMHTDDEAGYALLQCIASYLHINMYISLEVQTESTIAAGRAEVFEFQNHLEEYIKIVKETNPDTIKNWNFPKIHSGKHIFDDIMVKGAAHNFSTQPNEKQHGPIKKWYLQQTNHKNIADQYLDEERRKVLLSWDELKDTDEDDDELFEEHLHIGSPLNNHTSFAQVEEENKSSCTFHQFQKKLATFLNHFLPSHNIPLLEGTTWLKLTAHDQIHEHHYLKVHYKSAADWKLTTNYLKERCDYILICTQDKDGHNKNIFFITLHSIICGALLVPDFTNKGDYFLVDYVDTNMFLHTRNSLK